MRIALITRAPHLYSHRRLIETATKRGHSIDPINVYDCSIGFFGTRALVVHPRHQLEDYDFVLPRIGASTLAHGLTVVRQFEVEQVPILNSSESIALAGDKLQSMQRLVASGLSIPKTTFAHRAKKARALIKAVGGPPLIVKLLNGSLGMGVILAETDATAVSTIETFTKANLNILVQKFIAESAGTDVRALIVGDTVVGAMRRQGRAGEFRSNLHRGGKVEALKLDDQQHRVAVQAARAIGLNVAGVDLIQSDAGPLVLEVNATPGIEGLEAATQVDAATAIIQYVEEQVAGGTYA